MNKKEYILFIFEGKKTEPNIFKNLKKFFLHKKEQNISQDIIIKYGTVIYHLYKDFFIDDILDEDLDLVTILKPTNSKKDIVKTNQVSEIYLFFDYDGHAGNACDKKLLEMLKLFDNELDKGKLFVSYPMVEGLKHIKSDISFEKTIESSHKKYKQVVNSNCDKKFIDFNIYTKDCWLYLINQHSKKANFIISNNFDFPLEIIEQLNIFDSQKTKYIDPESKVAVLSSFPLFLLNYYGIDKFKDYKVKKDINFFQYLSLIWVYFVTNFEKIKSYATRK